MESVEVHALNFALKYAPPTLVMHYYLGNDPSREFVHQVKVFIKKNATAARIAEELIRVEPAYFNSKIVPKEQLTRLIQKLIDNEGKKVGHHKLRPTNSTRNKMNENVAPVQESTAQAQKVPETRLKEKRKPEISSLASKVPEYDGVEDTKPKHENKKEDLIHSLEEGENNYDEYGEELDVEAVDEDMIYGEAVDGDGKPIKLQRVMLEDENKEVLMDEEGNIYDLNGNYIGQLDTGEVEEENEGIFNQNHPKAKGNKRSNSP